MILETPQQLLRLVRTLPEHLPYSDKVRWPRNYSSHREHWIGWLGEYDGPGYYDRQVWRRSAGFVYNHLHNPGMLIWLAEGVKVDRDTIIAVVNSLPRGIINSVTNAADVRRTLSWQQVTSSPVCRAARR
jgi:hypothetical protein